MYFSGNGWLLVSLFLLQIDRQGHYEKWESTEECLQMCKNRICHYQSTDWIKNSEFGEWGQTPALTLLSYLGSQRKARWIKGLKRNMRAWEQKWKKLLWGRIAKAKFKWTENFRLRNILVMSKRKTLSENIWKGFVRFLANLFFFIFLIY